MESKDNNPLKKDPLMEDKIKISPFKESDIIFEEIARREYEVVGTIDKIIVVLGRPQKYPSGRDYYCSFKIISKERERTYWMIGMDEIQAIQYAFRMINLELSILNKNLKMLWGKENDLGFIEWDLISLKTLEGRLEGDKTIKDEDRYKLERRVKLLTEKERELKDYNSPEKVAMRKKMEEIRENMKE